MTYVYFVPQWFFGFDIAMDVLFAVVSLLVSWYAFTMYRISKQRESKLFGISFLLIALSYIIKSTLSLLIISEVSEGVRGLIYEKLTMLGFIGFYGYVILFSVGVVTFAYMTFRIKNIRVYSLLVVADILAIVLSENKALAFSIFSSLVLLYICIHYGIEYFRNKNGRTLLLFIAFVLLFLTGIEITAYASLFKFMIGQFLELGAYIIIFISLAITIGKRKIYGQKKNKT